MFQNMYCLYDLFVFELHRGLSCQLRKLPRLQYNSGSTVRRYSLFLGFSSGVRGSAGTQRTIFCDRLRQRICDRSRFTGLCRIIKSQTMTYQQLAVPTLLLTEYLSTYSTDVLRRRHSLVILL